MPTPETIKQPDWRTPQPQKRHGQKKPNPANAHYTLILAAPTWDQSTADTDEFWPESGGSNAKNLTGQNSKLLYGKDADTLTIPKCSSVCKPETFVQADFLRSAIH